MTLTTAGVGLPEIRKFVVDNSHLFTRIIISIDSTTADFITTTSDDYPAHLLRPGHSRKIFGWQDTDTYE